MTIPAYPMKRDMLRPLDPPPEEMRVLSECPITKARIWDGTTPWIITRYHDVRSILSHPMVSADALNPGYPRHSEGDHVTRQLERQLNVMDDPEHATYRRLFSKHFTIKRMEELRPRIQYTVDELIDAMVLGPRPADLVESLALPLPTLVISSVLGIPAEDHELFQETSETIMATDTSPEDSLRAARTMHEYLSRMLDEKAKRPSDDLLTELAVKYMATGEIPRERLTHHARFLLQAGHETTANMIALGTLALLQHPDQLAELRDSHDPSLVVKAVEELLRYLSISHGGRRRVASGEIELGGETIREGEGIIGIGETANRDSSVFANPDQLDIHRGSREHIAFGYGVHQCLGQSMARVELQVVYGTLFRRVPTLALACETGDLVFKEEMTVYGVRSLPVTW
jgi:cytochrome P450